MNNKSVSGRGIAVFATLLLICLASTSRAEAQQRCSAAALAGKWAFSYTGTIILPSGPVPVASVGLFTSKADDTLTGSETRSIGGQVAGETLTATYTVNPDCTARFHFQVFDSGMLARTADVNVVYENNGRAARGIFSALVLPDGTPLPPIITVTASRIFSE